jgi:hypothetical protein
MSDIQDRITAARREAENLKARIKTKKEELADADRAYFICAGRFMIAFAWSIELTITIILQFAKSPKKVSNRYLARA